MAEHERPEVKPDSVSPDERIANAYASTGGIGLMDDSMAGYIFQQQASGRWNKEEVDEAYDAHADMMKTATIGAGAAAVSAAADLTAFATAIGYNAYNMARGHSFAWPENMRNVPATSDWWGAQLGLSEEETNSLAFIGAGLAIAPSRALNDLDGKVVSKALKLSKAFGGGTRQAAVARRISAQRLLDEGMDENEIWQRTGWFPGKDKDGALQWRFYVSDADATIDYTSLGKKARTIPDVDSMEVGQVRPIRLRMDEVLQHDALYELYPEIAGYPITVQVRKTGPDEFKIANEYAGAKASFNPLTRKFRLNKSGGHEDARESLLHEAQHAIQSLENMQGGASNSHMVDSMYNYHAARLVEDVYRNPAEYEDIAPFEFQNMLEVGGFSEEEAEVIVKEILDVMVNGAEEGRVDYWKYIADKSKNEAQRWLSNMIVLPEGDKALVEFLDNMNAQEFEMLAQLRYQLDMGEMEARLVQAMKDVKPETLAKMKVHPHALMGYMATENIRELEAAIPGLKRMEFARPIEEAYVSGDIGKPLNVVNNEGLSAAELGEMLQKLEESDPELLAQIMKRLDDANIRTTE